MSSMFYRCLWTFGITLPFSAAIESRVIKWIGEDNTPSRWNGMSLVITASGLVNLKQNYLNYTYDFTVAFDERGKGKVSKIQKKLYRLSK